MPWIDRVQEAVAKLHTVSPFAFVLAALAGLLLAVTPSVLAMVPVIMGYVASESEITRGKAATRSFAFLLGNASTFGAYGLIFGWAGSKLAPLFGANGYLIAGIVLILLGALLLAKLQIRLPLISAPERKVHSVAGAYALGLPFGLVGSACPCSMPVVLSMLLYAGAVGNAWFGAALLFVFALVRGLPLMLAGTFTGILKEMRAFSRWRPWLEKGSGIALIVLGVVFVAQRFI